MSDRRRKVAILWRTKPGARGVAMAKDSRLYPVHEALTSLGIAVEPVAYSEALSAQVRERLLGVDVVLVWANPIQGDVGRVMLDALLREVAGHGVLVSTHPDTIVKIGTKEVLYETRELSWGTDTHRYETFPEFEDQFPVRLGQGRPRVLKQNRGNGGIGVWKVEVVRGQSSGRSARAATGDPMVRVEQAASRGDATDELALSRFMARCRHYFDNSGCIIDQAFAERSEEGMIRAYVVGEEVVGFARQRLDAVDPAAPAPNTVFGIPAAKTMYGPSEPEFQKLRTSLQCEWIPGLTRLVDIEARDLPFLWDCDFLYGPETASGESTYILCEINVSSVSPFPDTVPAKLAEAVLARLVSSGQTGPHS